MISDKNKLGKIRSKHQGRFAQGWIIALAIVLIGIVGAMIVRALSVIPLALLLGMFWLVLTLLWTPRCVVLREYGIEVRRFLHRPLFLSVEECHQVFRELMTHTGEFGIGVTDYFLYLVDSSGHGVRLSPKNIKDADALFPRLERMFVYPKRQVLLDAFEEGRDVAFGKITVSRSYMQIGERVFSWNDIKKIEWSPRRIAFHFHHARRQTLSFRKTPFPWILFSIAQKQKIEMTGVHGFKIG